MPVIFAGLYIRAYLPASVWINKYIYKKRGEMRRAKWDDEDSKVTRNFDNQLLDLREANVTLQESNNKLGAEVAEVKELKKKIVNLQSEVEGQRSVVMRSNEIEKALLKANVTITKLNEQVSELFKPKGALGGIGLSAAATAEEEAIRALKARVKELEKIIAQVNLNMGGSHK